MDGGSGDGAGCFTHETIEYELRRRVVAWYQPWRLCVRVALITVLVGRWSARS